MPNRLRPRQSPYLQQHADNPVDWYEWGPEAFEAARERGVPILLSIGYAACHWCHVMAHESFEDEETAALMNAGFVNIKVDREERPDVDAVYMEATQAINGGQGGWPMTACSRPPGEPLFCGTYLPARAVPGAARQRHRGLGERPRGRRGAGRRHRAPAARAVRRTVGAGPGARTRRCSMPRSRR